MEQWSVAQQDDLCICHFLLGVFVFVFVFVYVFVFVFVFVIVMVFLLFKACLLITLITYLKGHKSLRVLFGSVFKSVYQSVSQ